MTDADSQFNSGLFGLPRETQKVLNLNTLYFWRWLADRGELEQDPYGPPCGMDAKRRVPEYTGKLS